MGDRNKLVFSLFFQESKSSNIFSLWLSGYNGILDGSSKVADVLCGDTALKKT